MEAALALDFLFKAIAIGFTALMLLDFGSGLISLWNSSAIATYQSTLAFDSPAFDSLAFDSIFALAEPTTAFAPSSANDTPETQEEERDPWTLALIPPQLETQDTTNTTARHWTHSQVSLLPPAPAATDIEALSWASIKNLAKGRIQNWNRMKKTELIRAIAEAQITWRDVAAAKTA